MALRRDFIRELLADLFIFTALFCCLSPFLYILYGSMRPVWLAFGLLVPFFALFAARQIPWLPVFLAAHILLTAWPLLIPNIFLRMLLFLFMLISAAYSLFMRFRGGRSHSLPAIIPGTVLAAVIAIILEFHGLEAVSVSIHLCAFVMLSCYIVCAQTSRVDDSLDLLQDTARQPVKTTLRFHNTALVPFLMLCALTAFISALISLDAVTAGLHAAFKGLLRYIAAFVRWLGDLLRRFTLEVPVETEPQPAPSASILPETQPSPKWMEILDALLEYLVLAAIAALILFALIQGVRLLLKRFYARLSDDGYERAYIGPELKLEALGMRLRSFRRSFPSFGKSGAEKIRRAYYKKVSRHIRRGADVMLSDTVDEIGHKLFGQEDLSELTETYNQARYGSKR